MVYSYTQISQYLRCPRSYRYRYLDGWREKETRAAMAFGRSFETALGAYFRGEDCGAALFTEWGAYRDAPFEYKKGDTWDRLVHQGVHLLQRFVQDDRIRIHDPGKSLQIKILRSLPRGAEFVASALNNIAVFDLAPLEESPVKKRLFAKLNDSHHDEL
jgi:PD-(D/E)XK nuclease superfamily